MDLSILIVSHGHEEEIAKCLRSLPAAVGDLDAEIILVDNLGRPDFIDRIGSAGAPLRIISNPHRRGFGANMNAAARAASGDHLLILNPDTEHARGRLADAIAFLKARPDVGLAAARLINSDGTDQRNYRRFPTLPVAVLRGFGADGWRWRPGFYQRRMLDDLGLTGPTTVDWVFGSFMLMRRETFEALKGFDESYFMYYEDVDLCLRLRRGGLLCAVLPDLAFVHHHHRTSATELFGFHRRTHLLSLATYLKRAGYVFTPPY